MFANRLIAALLVAMTCPLVGYAVRSQHKWAITQNDLAWIRGEHPLQNLTDFDLEFDSVKCDRAKACAAAMPKRYLRAANLETSVNPSLDGALKAKGLLTASDHIDTPEHKRLWNGTDSVTVAGVAVGSVLAFAACLVQSTIVGLLVAMSGAVAMECSLKVSVKHRNKPWLIWYGFFVAFFLLFGTNPIAPAVYLVLATLLAGFCRFTRSHRGEPFWAAPFALAALAMLLGV